MKGRGVEYGLKGSVSRGRIRGFGVYHEKAGDGSKPYLTHSWDLSGRGNTRAEDAQGAPAQSHISPDILVYENKREMSHNKIFLLQMFLK